MSETQNTWTGETIAGRYQLGKRLGGSDHSEVFLTEIVHARSQKVAIKLIPAAGLGADRQLERWKAASQLAHANLLKILDYGKCEHEGKGYFFVVVEYADEDLSQILPERALSGDEARAMVEPALLALAFLHEKNLVHTRVHPANVLAIGDQIKLSSDAISPVGEKHSYLADSGPFSAPEWAKGISATAEDVWSVGATIHAALTQQPPATGQAGNAELALPEGISEPFAGMVKACLKQDPQERASLHEIRAKLNPASAPPAAVREVRNVDRAPVASLPPAPRVAADLPPVRAKAASGGYLLPVTIAVIVAILLFALPKLLRQQPEANSSASKAGTSAPVATRSERHSTPANAPASASAKSKQSPIVAAEQVEPVAAPAPPPVKPASKPSSTAATKGEILDQVLPEISQKARETIHGTVRVSVRMHVNASGTVEAAELDSRGGSKYFGEQAIKAAKRWQFAAPEVGGRSVESDWVVRFEFSSLRTNARPTQVSP
jgi:TonB family protein